MPLAAAGTGHHVIGLELGIFIALFLLVAGLGFAAVRWRKVESLASLDEWGLGGRAFGTFISWFLIGGDLYTAYTFIAIPALLYGAGERSRQHRTSDILLFNRWS